MEVTDDLIKRRSKHFDLGCVTLLDLSLAGLRQLGNLKACTNLQELNLSNNEILSAATLPRLDTLRVLDLSSNELTTIDDLPVLPALERLVLQGNRIASIDLSALSIKLPKLLSLNLAGNPVALLPSYLCQVLAFFPNLLTLDNEAAALHRVLSSAQRNSATPNSPDSAHDCAASTPVSAPSPLKLPPFNIDQFVARETQAFNVSLAECQQLLESETAKFMLALQTATQ